ncbi:MAG: response regulator [Anaerolineae bacterium]|nr:response regulator [Anaerolineae bacterium]
MDKLKVLVVDDSPQIREFVIEYVLRPNGFEIDQATDGAEGLQKVLSGKPDLVLMDYEMPKMTGIEVLRNLRAQGCKVPVILMTSHGSEQVAVEVFRLGAKDYLVKPFAAQEMLDTIEEVLTVTRLRHEKETLTRRVMQANQRLEQHIRELNTLYQVGKSINALMQPNKMLERIVDAVLFVTRCQECSLVLVDSDTGKVGGCLRKKRGPDGNHTPQKTRSVTKLLVLDEEDCVETTRGPTETILSVPLQVGQRVIGTLSISKQITGQFTSHDDRLLRMLADYAAIAIHNMQLMRQLHLTKEREKQQIRGLFERYVAPTVVEQLLTRSGEVELGGMRQPVTVLFADVRGFSSFSSQISPEVLVELLNQYMRVAAEAVLAQEGTLDKFMGDAVMAFFNAPLPQSDHPVRAVKAAWNLCRLVEKLHQHLPPEHRLRFGVGVGIGEAVVGNIGTAQMMNYTVIGDSVNKVKRLQEQAKGGQILISQETFYLVQDYAQAQSVGDLLLKGQSQPEPVYEVVDLFNR